MQQLQSLDFKEIQTKKKKKKKKKENSILITGNYQKMYFFLNWFIPKCSYTSILIEFEPTSIECHFRCFIQYNTLSIDVKNHSYIAVYLSRNIIRHYQDDKIFTPLFDLTWTCFGCLVVALIIFRC